MHLHIDKNLVLESNCRFEDSDFVIVGYPFDSTSSYRPGSRFAPLEIRREFLEMEEHHKGSSCGKFDFGIYDLGNISVVHGNATETNKRLKETLANALQERKNFVPVVIGGEHTLTFPAVDALKGALGELQVVSFDAHPDMNDHYLGEKISHATVMRRIHELGVDVYNHGARSYDKESKEYFEKNCKPLSKVKNRKTYISIDMDVLDPAIAPGVSTPEAGGAFLHRTV